MSQEKNKYGLSRYIEEPIKRQIRQVCGFGCVICGIAVTSYEHIEPEFHEATIHDPENMALLCEGCHSRVTRNFWSKQKVKDARKAPKCIQDGKCHDAFDISKNSLVIWIGSVKIINIETIFKVNNNTLLAIEPPEEPGAPYRLSGKFYNSSGKFLFEIVRNEWFGESNNWDIECKGGRIIIRTSPSDVNLQILCNPPTGIIIEKMNMFIEGTQFTINRNYAIEVTNKKSNSRIIVSGRYIKAETEGCIAFASYVKDTEDGNADYRLTLGGGGEFELGSLEFKDFPEKLQTKISNRLGRVKKNELCPCHSGKKFKKCCGKF